MSSSSSSSSLSSSHNWFYHVFPSFSEKDVRISFLSHFHKEMDRKLITTFKDNDDIDRSQSIKPKLVQAIRDSRISVVVFSKNYASSSWCLDELLEIMRCKEVLGQVVIPIFYGLDPSHVRNQTGDFGKIFEKTCTNITEEVINQWKAALTDVANMAGFDFASWNNETKMIEAVADDVLDKLNITPWTDLGEFVGMGDHMANLKDLLRLESDEVRMIGIWGPSGIGKTIIARAMYHQLSPRFQGSLFVDRDFLSKVRETFNKTNPDDYNMKLALQNKFLSKILGKKDIQIDHLGAIGESLKNQKVLLCIDDLDDQVVLDALAGNSGWFGSGSRIIVVTTDKRLLTAHEINNIYPVGLPSNNQALEMFCRAAFEANSPPDGLKNFSSEVVELAGSLPLGLQVLGSSLRRLGKDACLKMLPRFRRSLDGKIEKTLRVSYDGLNKEDKAIFRHIPCLFNDMKIRDIMLLLAYSGLDVDLGMNNLVDKSLINVRDNTMSMHHLLRKMGNDIFCGQSDEPREREFLWDANDIFHVLNGNNGTNKVLSISLDMFEFDELHVHECAFKVRNLRFLEIQSNRYKARKSIGRLHVPESFDYMPPKLKYLYWDYFPMRCMPSNFRPENLVKLEMRYSKLEKLWEGALSLSCLIEMDLSGSEKLQEIPNLSKADNLERLYHIGCSSLVELPSSIRNLNKLVVLNMQNCTKLETIPTCINLVSLDKLIMGGCPRLRIFPNISTNISNLFLRETAIEDVLQWIENFSRLKSLDMSCCSNLKYVHLNIFTLKHLDRYDFHGCKDLTRVNLRGYGSGMAMRAYNASKFELHFFDCFKWDQNALRQQQVFLFLGLISLTVLLLVSL